ncbi:MAG: class I SAM-dependent methyltransferase [Planctomycetes bacterium]|nr:class I SAM-dependent methyltransferase [Planctomycetota bacterium]
MTLADEYKQQLAWRSWKMAYDALPSLQGATVLDLGRGVGDQAAEFVARGARVIGVDINDELLDAARSRNLPNAIFQRADLRTPLDIDTIVDGIWCGFTAAYFPDLPIALTRWDRHVRPGGWIALTEIDNLFEHEPVSDRTAELLEAYVQDALTAGRYDFRMGRKLRGFMEQADFSVVNSLTLPDVEFSSYGPADPGVLDAWEKRFECMMLLRDFCGREFERVRREFLHCLACDEHRSKASVQCCIAVR